jgi:TP901 family phage tail tape measure protein
VALNNIGLGFILRARDMASAAFRSAERAVTGLQRRATSAGAELDDVSSMLTGTGKKMMAVGAAGIAGLGLASNSAMDFGKSVAEVASIADKAEFPIERIKKIGMDMTGTYGGDVNKQVKTLYQAISSGASTSAQATALMHEANKLAIGGLSDSFLAIDAMTNVLNAYGMDMSKAAQVSDAMFVTVNKGKTTIDELANVIGRVAPTASAMGVSMDDMFAAVTAASTRLGNASESVTGFKAALSNIMSPTKEAGDEAKRLGIQFDAAALRSKGLAKFMQDITSSGQYNADTMGKLFGSIEAFNFVSAIASENGKALGESMSAMSKKSGAAGAAFGIVNESASQAADRLKGKFQIAIIRLGEAILPVLDGIVGAVESMVSAWNNAPPFVHKATAAFIAIGSVLLIVIGALMTAVGAVLGFQAAGISVAAVQGAFAAMVPVLGYVALALAAIVAAVAAIGYAFEANVGGFGDKMRAEFNKAGLAWTALVELVSSGQFSEATAKELSKTENQGMLKSVVELSNMFSGLGSIWDAFVQGFKDGIQAMAPMWEALGSTLSASLDEIGKAFATLGEGLGGAGEGMGGLQMIAAGLGATLSFIGTTIATVVNTVVYGIAIILPTIIGVVRAIVAVLGGLVDAVIHVGELLGAIFSGDWAAAWNILKQIVFDIVAAVIDGVALMVEGIAGSIDAMVNAVKPGTSALRENVAGARKDMKADLASLMDVSGKSVSAEIAASSFGTKQRGTTTEDLNKLLEVSMPKMAAPTPATAPGQAAAAPMDAASLAAALQQGQKGAPPVDVTLKSVIVMDSAPLAELVQKYAQAAGQRGLSPTPIPQ